MITDKQQPAETNNPSFIKQYKERFQSSMDEIRNLYNIIYAFHPKRDEGFDHLLETIENSFALRRTHLRQRDLDKLKSEPEHWFLSNQLCGMSLYVDRFCGSLPA